MKNEHEPNLGSSGNIFSFVFNFGVVLFFLIRLVMGSRWIRKKTNKKRTLLFQVLVFVSFLLFEILTKILKKMFPRGETVPVSAPICIVVCECVRVLIELESFHQDGLGLASWRSRRTLPSSIYFSEIFCSCFVFNVC